MPTDVQQAEFVERTRCINCNSERLIELSRGKFTSLPLAQFIGEDPSGEDILPYFQNAEWIFVRCSDCNQMFHKRILTNTWNERRFSEWMTSDSIREFEERANSGQFASRRKFEAGRSYITHVLRIEKLTRRIRKADEAVRLLDFGCGFGGFLLACKTFGFEAVGVDRAIPRIEEAYTNVFPSLNALPECQNFHAITLFEVLEHLDDPIAILQQLAALLPQDGLLILETPDCSGVTGIHTRYDYLKIHPLEHVNAFTHATLRSIAERSGFKLIRRGPAFVATETFRLAKRIARHALGRDGKSTQLYFSKI